ncbi:hypothetical protein [Maribacter sp. IgM3_T14_3]|uniref:hypothetical protein n=1 Tax=Maribacter sp. IgM3_T14_3 TaxID=3415140 RepID=UPI003C703BCB
MKNYLLIPFGVCLMCFHSSNSQESFKKKYRIKKQLNFSSWKYKITDDSVIVNTWERKTTPNFLEKDNWINYKKAIDLDYLKTRYSDEIKKDPKYFSGEEFEEEFKKRTKAVNKIDSLVKLVANNLKYSIELDDIGGNKFTITEKEAKNKEELSKIIGYNDKIKPDFYSGQKDFVYKGNILFEKDKIYVNLWNFEKSKYSDDKKVLYYTLTDGQTAKLKFWEWTASALTIPLKYRLKDEKDKVNEVFTTAFNAGLFYGHTYGKTKFNYREKIGNRTITKKYSAGLFLGTAAETLNKSNTDTLVSKISGSETRTIGLLSTGLGFIHSRNNLALGVFIGWDIGAGEISNSWYYDERMWIGIGIGYDIFKL